MIVTRWQATLAPNKQQIVNLLTLDGLEPFVESFEPNVKIHEHRHPFCEIRIVIEGELLFNISGNQFLLRAGDRVEIPANTKHSHGTNGNAYCLCVCANKVL